MNSRGFTFTELLLVIAIIGVLSVLAAPTLFSYIQTSGLRAGARELASAINLGRQLAIARNTTVCVEVEPTTHNIRLRTNNPPNPCLGTIWTGPGTDSAGFIKVSNPALRITTTANVVFTNLGAASTTGTYTVTNTVYNKARTVDVAPSGRVNIL